MPEELARKKSVRAGHRASATRMVNKARELLAEDAPDVAKLSQLRLSLQEKLDVLKQLDGEILDLVDESSVAEEIEQADEFKEDVYTILIGIEHISRDLLHDMTSQPPSPLSGCQGFSCWM